MDKLHVTMALNVMLIDVMIQLNAEMDLMKLIVSSAHSTRYPGKPNGLKKSKLYTVSTKRKYTLVSKASTQKPGGVEVK